ncbi:MAG: hypothetical protein QM767_29225 [Anaeromyxobacter sp.]
MQRQSIAASLGIALARLTRGPALAPEGALQGGALDAPAAPGAPRVVWRQEASGTLPAARVVALEELEDPEGRAGVAAPEGGSWQEDGREAAPPEEAAPDRGADGHAGPQAAAADDLDYDDGYGPEARAAALDSAFPAGSPEPDELLDEEAPEESVQDEAAPGDEARSAGAGAAAYRDEADLAPAAEPPPLPQAALDRVLDELIRGREGTLLTLARPTERDGLAFGATQATQRSGELGRLLARLRATDGAGFARVFGPDAEALLATTGAATEEARLQAVGGQALVDEPWRARFAEAGRHPPFVEAQRAFARDTLLTPLVPIARDLGLGTRALAMLAAIAVARGPDAGLRWALGGIGPGASAAQLQAALGSLGDADLAAFQRRQGLTPSGELDPTTHARLLAALRALGARAPVPTLTAPQVAQAWLRQAAREPFRHKLESLASSPALEDRAL